jgi:hypothetical protein
MLTWNQHIKKFYSHIRPPAPLPHEVEVMVPFSEPQVKAAFEAFYGKFYNDTNQRKFIIGINPGRFGGGITGIPFTDPIRLEQDCGIPNSFQKRQELSSVFVYKMIEAFGGTEAFYKEFYITSYSPLGFTRHGKNLNYYDDKMLASAIEPYAADCIREQLSWNGSHETAFCWGDGKNFQYVSRLNEKHGFFKKIIPLSHPRFIMQYKLKQLDQYIDKYLQAFGEE